MIILTLYVLANFGFAYIVGFSKISAPLRELLAPYVEQNDPTTRAPGAVNAARYWLISLLECPACIGFHTGWIAIALHIVTLPLPLWQALLTAALTTTASNFVLGRWTRII